MSQWLSRFENHQVHSQIQQINELLDQVENDALKQSDGIEDYNRLKLVISLISRKLSEADPLLVGAPTLNSISSHAKNIIQELSNYNANKNIGHLTNANNHSDHLLVQAHMLSPVYDIPDIDGLRESIGNFRKSAGQYLHHMENDFSKLQSKTTELSNKCAEIFNEINVQKGRLDTAITQFQQQFSEAAEKRREQFSESEKQRNNEYNAKISNFNKEFSILMEKVEEDFKGILKKFTDITDNQIDNFEKISNKEIEQLKYKKEEASNLVQIIGNIGVTGNFQKIANQEKKTADWLRKVALTLMICMVFVIGLTIFISTKNGFDWKLAIFRIGAALILAIPATYAATESSKHRSSEFRNRQSELELASIDLFLEKMPDEKKHELKAKLTDRFFGCSQYSDVIEKEKVSQSSLFDLIKLTINNLTKK